MMAADVGKRAVAELINHRVDGRKWPLNFPAGWLPAVMAVEDYAKVMLNSAAEGRGWFYWFFLQPEGLVASPSDPRPSWDAMTLYARANRKAVAAGFAEACQTGELKTGFSRIGGGAVEPMDGDLWRTDDIYLRFRTLSFDPAEPYSERLDLPCWLWVEEAGFRHLCDKLRCKQRGWEPPRPPHSPRTENYLSEDGTLLETWHFDERGMFTGKSFAPAPPIKSSKAGRPGIYTRTRKLFADHLRAGAVADKCQWEGEAIVKDWGDTPPKAETCADQIRKFYKMIRRAPDGTIVNVAEVLEAMDFPINPDKSLSMPMKAA